MDQITLLFMGGMLLVTWLFFIRPQAKQAKLAKEFQASIDKGAKVVTTGGIHGRVVKSDETTVSLEIDNNVRMRVDKTAISMDMTKAAYGDNTKKAEAADTAKQA
ncbi:MAG TPA: preprotein translocase subunit YajC [Chitinophagales bacterium]|nr:preprotein translocase subunit YajC [Chitinophagales bacterium]